MDNKNVDITELHQYYTEDAKNDYTLVKIKEYFYHKRSEKVSKAETDDSDSGTSSAIDNPHEGDSDQSSSCDGNNGKKRNLVDKCFDLGNGMQVNEEDNDIDKSWSSGGYSSGYQLGAGCLSPMIWFFSMRLGYRVYF